MNWEEQYDKAIATLKDIAESDTIKDLTSKAKVTASNLAKRAKEGALSAAEAFVEANADPSTVKVRYLNADFSIVSPSDGLEITRPQGGTLAISDGAGNAVVINASAERTQVTETVGTVKKLNDNTYDLGTEDGVNVGRSLHSPCCLIPALWSGASRACYGLLKGERRSWLITEDNPRAGGFIAWGLCNDFFVSSRRISSETV